MSGFVALFQRSGAPVDRALLGRLTSFLAFRGPDGCEQWSGGAVGLGHTLFRTTRPGRNERQPVSFDGHSWIVADARLDRRSELKDELAKAGQDVDRNASDAELILHAFFAWTDDCVRHIYGDFAFAIWDAREQRLFCARDHFGIKPFYYAVTRDFVLCSNTLECIRQHPGVSGDLNDQAVADFLLFGLNCDRGTTIFKDIRRLTPAHTFHASADDVRAQRYWSVPVDGRIRYRREEEYAEHFRHILHLAVADRTAVDRVGIFLSGGMDSGSIAATAAELARDSDTQLKGCTVTHEQLLGDREGYFARQTADFLKIPLEIISTDHLQPFGTGDESEFAFPEPLDDPMAYGIREQFAAVAKDSRVALYGEGVDNLMYFQLAPYLKDSAKRGEWLTLSAALGGYLWKQRSRWHRLSHRLKRRFASKELDTTLPPWIAPEFARRVNLRERFKHFGLIAVSPAHPVLPIAHASLQLPHWLRLFEVSNAGFTRELVEIRYPFLDLRIVEYLLALPPFPLFFQKRLERDAMKDKLPESILRRPKTPLGARPCVVAMEKSGEGSLRQIDWSDEIARYVSREHLFDPDESEYSEHGKSCIRAVCFNFWLRAARRIRYNFELEVRNG